MITRLWSEVNLRINIVNMLGLVKQDVSILIYVLCLTKCRVVRWDWIIWEACYHVSRYFQIFILCAVCPLLHPLDMSEMVLLHLLGRCEKSSNLMLKLILQFIYGISSTLMLKLILQFICEISSDLLLKISSDFYVVSDFSISLWNILRFYVGSAPPISVWNILRFNVKSDPTISMWNTLPFNVESDTPISMWNILRFMCWNTNGFSAYDLHHPKMWRSVAPFM